MAACKMCRMQDQREPASQRVNPELLHHNKALLIQLAEKLLPILK